MVNYSKDDEEYYTQGGCHEFAIALHRLKGFSFVVVESENIYKEDEDSNIENEVIHVYAYNKKSNTLIDIMGEIPYDKLNSDIEEMFNETPYNVIHIHSEKELIESYISDNEVDRQLFEYSNNDIAEAINKITEKESLDIKESKAPSIS